MVAEGTATHHLPDDDDDDWESPPAPIPFKPKPSPPKEQGPVLDPASALAALHADPEFKALYERMALALRGQGVPLEDPGPGEVTTCLEAYARAQTDTSVPSISLGLTLPAALVAGSAAGQGAYWSRVRLPDGNWLKIPMIIQAMVVAPSGYGKSTVLDPLADMVDRLSRDGITRRKKIIEGLEKKTPTVVGSSVKAMKAEKTDKIYANAACKSQFTVDSGTPEGIRRRLMSGGGCSAIITSEPDVLREISAYAKDGGTFRYFLDGWDGKKVTSDRASGAATLPRVVLPFSILLQPTTFDSFVTAERSNGGVAGTDAVGRGVFGRSWLVRIEDEAGVASPAYCHCPPGGDGEFELPIGLEVEAMLDQLMVRSDPYRCRMGVYIGWEDLASRNEEGDMPPPELPEPIWLGLADDAVPVFSLTQNMRRALADEVKRMPEVAPLFTPMARRWTQHVIRVAQVLTLAADPGAVDIPGWAMRDAGLRLVPWLTEHWLAEMYRLHRRVLQALLEQEIRANGRRESLTPEGQLINVLSEEAQRYIDAGIPDDELYFDKNKIIEKATNKMRETTNARQALRNPMREAFKGLVAEKVLSEVMTPAAGDKGGRPLKLYRLSLTLGKLRGVTIRKPKGSRSSDED